MIIEQNFSESDLEEVTEIFEKSMEIKYPILKYTSRFNKAITYLLIISSLTLFICSVLIITLGNEFSKEIILYVGVGVLALLMVLLRNKLGKEMIPMNIVKRKYGHPFSVTVEENTFSYKQFVFSYTDIKLVVEYKNFLFIRTRNRLLIIKTDVKEKDAIFSKLEGIKTIKYLQKDKPFDLRKIK